MTSPTTTGIIPRQIGRKHTHPSLLDDLSEDPDPPCAPKKAKSEPSGGLTDIEEQENTTTESSSGQPDADHVHQGAAHANDEQASPPPQANDGSIRGRLRARARRIRDKVKKLGGIFK